MMMNKLVGFRAAFRFHRMGIVLNSLSCSERNVSEEDGFGHRSCIVEVAARLCLPLTCFYPLSPVVFGNRNGCGWSGEAGELCLGQKYRRLAVVEQQLTLLADE